MRRRAHACVIALAGAGLWSGCSAPPPAPDPVEEVREALARHAEAPVEIQSVSINGEVICGWAAPAGPFFFEQGTLILWSDDPTPFSRCGSDFIEPGPPAPMVY